MAGFGNTPVTTGTPVGTPLGSVAVPGHSGGDLTALRGSSPSTDGNGNETAAVAAVIENANSNGQTTMANSSPVTLASNQTGIGTIALPTISDDWLRQATRNGQAFVARQAITAAVTGAIGLFNGAGSGKSLLVYRALIFVGIAGSTCTIYTRTTDFAYGTVTQAAVNKAFGNGTASVATVSGAATGITGAGTALSVGNYIANTPVELILPTSPFVLPAGSAQALGFVLSNTSGAQGGNIMLEWIEF